MSSRPIEVLESRTLLAGDVAVAFARGGLTLRGDDLGNHVAVGADGTAGGVRVTGLDGTTLNGRAEPLTFDAITRGLKAKLGDGDDRLALTGVTVGRGLSVDTGRGADAVTLDGGSVGRCLAVTGKSGGKSVDVRFADVAGRARVRTGNEADAVDLRGSTFAKRVSLRTGGGDDAITLASAFAKGRSVKDGPGDDSLVEGVYRGFDFRDGEQGWVGGFADYFAGREDYFQLTSGLRDLPPELGDPGTGFLLSGLNHSDDLFMFLKRRLGPEDGILAGQVYRLDFDITFASNAPSNGFGVGGSPGESVFLKAGGSAEEPIPIKSGGGVEMNVDKGFQSNGGSAATVIGDVANGIPPSGKTPLYVSVRRSGTHAQSVQSSEGGALWLLIGTDSGYESTTALYYQQIRVTLTPVSL